MYLYFALSFYLSSASVRIDTLLLESSILHVLLLSSGSKNLFSKQVNGIFLNYIDTVRIDLD